MKIAFLCLAFYAYVISANEEIDGQPVAKHTFMDIYGHGHFLGNRFLYRPPVQPRPWPVQQPQFRPRPQPRPQPPRMSINNRFVLSYFLYRALRPASTTTTVPITTATNTKPTTTTATTTTTANPLADWTEVGDRYYIFPESAATWNEANSECQGLVDGGRLAVDGFNVPLAQRQVVTDALGWEAGDDSFWIGGQYDTTVGASTGVDHTNYGTFVASGTSILCGLVNGDAIFYNNCDDPELRYVCECCA